MAQIFAVVSVVSGIIKAISMVKTLRDLLIDKGDTATSFKDEGMGHTFRHEMASFFIAINTKGELERIHRDFYHRDLLVVVNDQRSVAKDLEAGGVHYHLSEGVQQAMASLWKLINPLRICTHRHSTELHVDDLINGQILFMGLLYFYTCMPPTHAGMYPARGHITRRPGNAQAYPVSAQLRDVLEDPMIGLRALAKATMLRRQEGITFTASTV